MNKKGFTLIELLITVAIIGILAAIAIPAYVGQQKKAARSEASTNLQNLRLLEEQYFAENGRYAPNPDGSATYTTTSTTLQTAFPRFLPGSASTLSYNYSVTSSGTGATFTATAAGKAGTRVAGDANCTIDQNNTRTGPCW